jgi:hypothetical protein
VAVRITKFPAISGVGTDFHGVAPPSSAPVPPNPAPIPTAPWLSLDSIPAMQLLVTGKYSDQVFTESFPDTLWQSDWGPMQVHIPLTPVQATPSRVVLFLASSTKFWMASFAVKEAVGGAVMAGGGSAPVAVSLPVWLTNTQKCQDVVCAYSFVAPLGIGFVVPSIRWVGYCFGDLAANAIGMVGDALTAMIFSKFGGKLLPKTVADDQLFGGLASALMGHVTTLIGNKAPWASTFTGALGVAFAAVFETAAPAVVAGAAVSELAGKLANGVGEEIGSRDSYQGVRGR